MKKNPQFFIFYAILLCFSVLISCDRDEVIDPQLTVDAPAEIVFNVDGTGGVNVINITTNQLSWGHELDPADGNGWLTALPSGNTLSLTALPNDSGEVRENVELRITAGDAEAVVITVKQQEYVRVAGTQFHIEGLSGDISVTYTDGSSTIVAIDVDGKAIIYDDKDSGKIIYAISSGVTDEVLIGRKAGETIGLRFDNEKLLFREPVEGAVPIGSYAELALLDSSDESLAESYYQEADLDLLGSEELTAAGLVRQNWMPIGERVRDPDNRTWTEIPFIGSYDGKGLSINNLFMSIETSEMTAVGFFAFVGVGGTISDIHISSGLVSTKVDKVDSGVICGLNRGNITGCSNASEIVGMPDSQIAGICAVNEGTISDCVNTADINGLHSAAGICYASIGTISSCHNSGKISISGIHTVYPPDTSVVSPPEVAGICLFNAFHYLSTGERIDGTIKNCSNTGDISASGAGNIAVGGICGVNYVNIESCFNTGNITVTCKGVNFVGGVCAYNGNLDGTILYSYNTGDIVVNDTEPAYVGEHIFVGGVSGFCGDSFTKGCYNTGDISANKKNGIAHVGGVSGALRTVMGGGRYDLKIIESCYNTGNISSTGSMENYVGGVCGHQNGWLKSSYSTGSVSGTGEINYSGGACGYNDGIVAASYWLRRGDELGVGEDVNSQGINVAAFSDSSWPGVGDVPGGGSWADSGWGVGNNPDAGENWKSLGAWVSGSTPDGVNSNFPKLYWEL